MNPPYSPLQIVEWYWADARDAIVPPLLAAGAAALLVWLLIPNASIEGLQGRTVWLLGWLRLAAAMLFTAGALWPGAIVLQYAVEITRRVIYPDGLINYWTADEVYWARHFRVTLLAPMALLLWKAAPLVARLASRRPLLPLALGLKGAAAIALTLMLYTLAEEAMTRLTWKDWRLDAEGREMEGVSKPPLLAGPGEWTDWSEKFCIAAVGLWLLGESVTSGGAFWATRRSRTHAGREVQPEVP